MDGNIVIHVGDTGYAVFAKRAGTDKVCMFNNDQFDHYLDGMKQNGLTPVIVADQSVDFGNYHGSQTPAEEMAARDARIRQMHANGALGECW